MGPATALAMSTLERVARQTSEGFGPAESIANTTVVNLLPVAAAARSSGTPCWRRRVADAVHDVLPAPAPLPVLALMGVNASRSKLSMSNQPTNPAAVDSPSTPATCISCEPAPAPPPDAPASAGEDEAPPSAPSLKPTLTMALPL